MTGNRIFRRIFPIQCMLVGPDLLGLSFCERKKQSKLNFSVMVFWGFYILKLVVTAFWVLGWGVIMCILVGLMRNFDLFCTKQISLGDLSHDCAKKESMVFNTIQHGHDCL